MLNAGQLQKATVANGPGAFNPAQWALAGAQLIVSDTMPANASDGSMWWESDTGLLYVRYNDGNSTQWVIACPQPDLTQFVQKSGDTMSGDLHIANPGTYSNLWINKQASGGGAQIVGQTNGKTRWVTSLGNEAAETGGNAGSDFLIDRFDDNGAMLDAPLIIKRSTGVIDFAKKPTVAGAAWAAPMDALAYSGLQINGGGDINQAQRGASNPVRRLSICLR